MPNHVDAEKVLTPWGEAGSLRERRLPPGPGSTREEAARSQRERLYGAMVACTVTRGYRSTAVADLLELAAVSRASFYNHFADKGQCFEETARVILRAGLAALRTGLETEQPWEQRGRMALANLLDLVAAQPAAAQAVLVEAYAAGPNGQGPIHEAFEASCELTHLILGQLPGRSQPPQRLVRAVIGGLHRILYQHLHRGEAAALPARCEELWRWASGFLAPPAVAPAQRRLRRHRVDEPPPYAGRDEYERIVRAFAAAVADRGYPRTTIAQIVTAAGISQATFYRHFRDKDDALVAALDSSGAQLMAAVLPPARRAQTWQQAVRRALTATCTFFAAEQSFARLRAVEVYSAGPLAIEQRDQAWRQILAELVPEQVLLGANPGDLAIEASSGGVYALIYEAVRRGETEELPRRTPLLSYIMLTPLVGEAAARALAGRDAQTTEV